MASRLLGKEEMAGSSPASGSAESVFAIIMYACNALVAQLVGGGGFKSRTVEVRILSGAPVID
jgi:hypothetical protein